VSFVFAILFIISFVIMFFLIFIVILCLAHVFCISHEYAIFPGVVITITLFQVYYVIYIYIYKKGVMVLDWVAQTLLRLKCQLKLN